MYICIYSSRGRRKRRLTQNKKTKPKENTYFDLPLFMLWVRQNTHQIGGIFVCFIESYELLMITRKLLDV